jgi:hypothetical protein
MGARVMIDEGRWEFMGLEFYWLHWGNDIFMRYVLFHVVCCDVLFLCDLCASWTTFEEKAGCRESLRLQHPYSIVPNDGTTALSNSYPL